MIAWMALAPGSHTVGPEDGRLQVRTYREGIAQKVGHDLIIDVGKWQATVQAAQDGNLSSVELEVDPRSLQVREGHRGVKPLTDKDRGDIAKTIDEKVLGGRPIAFHSDTVEGSGGTVRVRGELNLAGASRPASFELEMTDDGHLTGTMPVTQSDWGIKPYRGFMGALKVRDTVEVAVDAQLPGD
jgi:polyisoprenoid-binding protein YceI